MKLYMAIYMAPAASIAELMKAGPAEGKAFADAWGAWSKTNSNAISAMGSPLGKTKTVSATGVSDTHNEITGYSVVKADSHDAAAKLFAGHPHLRIKGATIEVMEYVDLPDM